MDIRNFIVLVLILFGGQLFAQRTPLIVEGTYQGRNLYVKNPYRNEKVGFCVSKVTVNNKVTTDEINSSSFEVDLSLFQFKRGEKVTVKIYHSKGCKPKVINPESVEPRSTFNVNEIFVSNSKVLNWSTQGETGVLNYIIEQYKWDEWVKVGEVKGVGKTSVQKYKFEVACHSGENKFRVYQKDYTGQKRISKVVRFNNDVDVVTFYPKKVRKDIVFSASTLYEIYDTFGNIVKKGAGLKLDCSTFRKGFYYLKYDNAVATFNKK